MGCHFSDAEGVTQCFKLIAPWFEIILGLLQITIVAAIGSLIWVIRRWRNESENWEREKSELATKLDTAERVASVSEREAAFLGKEIERLQRELDQHPNRDSELVITKLRSRLNAVERVATQEAADFWSRPACSDLPQNIGPTLSNYLQTLSKSIPIILFANQKGGVGKTTTAANIGASWASKGKRVLMVDLDYQGSLTHLARFQTGDQRAVLNPAVGSWLDGQSNVDFPDTISPITKDLHYVSCGYRFETLERQLEYSWILGREETDVRYRLASVLQSPFIQQTYDCVILDAPPRLTTGFINGFTAANYLYVPTVVDRLSVTAVRNFAATFSKLQPKVNPSLQLTGVIGTMTWVDRLANNVRDFAEQIDIQLRNSLKTDKSYFIKDAVIKRDTAITQCLGIAYLQNDTTSNIFDRLGTLMWSQVFGRKPNGRAARIESPARAGQIPLELQH